MICNIEAEQKILGAILFEPDSMLETLDILSVSDLYKDAHKEILNACLDVYQDGGAIDLVSITERLTVKGKLAQCGGAYYLAQLVDVGFTAANIKTHSRIVKEKSVLRRIHTWSINLQKKTSEGQLELKSFINEIERDVISFAEKIVEKKSPDIADIITDIEKQWRDMAEGQQVFIPLDYKFDTVIPHYAPGHLIVLGGYTSQGKSTLLAQMIVDACEEGAKCLGFSLEDSREDKGIKFIANLSDIPQRKLMTGELSDQKDIFAAEDRERINKATRKLKEWDMKLYDDIYTIDELRLKIKKHKLREKIDIVFIDYIQNIQGDGSLYDRISDAIIKLQKIAKEMKVTIIVVSQVTNEAMKSNSEVIGLKGAGELAAAADIVLWIKRVKGDGKEHFLDCEVRKNRPFGKCGLLKLRFSDNWNRIDKRWLDE